MFAGVAALRVDYWRRKAERTEQEAKRVREKLERTRREVDKRELEERMKHDERV